MKALIISDVHGNTKLLEEIIEKNKDVDLKIFLGDLEVSQIQQERIVSIFDYSVIGNCDFENISPLTNLINFGGVNIFILHGHSCETNFKKIDFNIMLRISKQNNATLVLHGHDHIASLEEKSKITRFNPGTISINSQKKSYGILEIENKKIIKLEHIFI